MERRRLGPWRRGDRFGSIIADHATGWDDDANVKSYGGHMVCESVASDDIADLIAAAPGLQARVAELEEALKEVLSALVAATSILDRADIAGRRPSKVVGSDTMFMQMMKDYAHAEIKGRVALSKISAEGAKAIAKAEGRS